MAKQGSNKDREKEKEMKRRRRFWAAAQLLVGPWARKRFHFSFDESFEPADIDGPVLVAVNHASAYDPIFVGIVFKNKPLTFIASEHILRSKWGPFLNSHISFIPHQKGARGSRTALVAMKRIKKGESIFLAVEGEQTWNGRPLPVMPYTGKLVKSSGATLVTYRIEGAYLSAPRWALSARRGKVYGRTAGVYSPEVLKEMSDEEVEKLIAKDLAFDIWEWQKTRPEGPVVYKCIKGGNADGIERSVFTCPECGRMGTLRSEGDFVGCSCGFKVRMEDTGFFGQPAPFGTVADWEKADLKILKKAIEDIEKTENSSGSGSQALLFEDDNITLYSIENGHEEREAANGRLALIYRDGSFRLCIGDREFSMSSISSMTMVLAGRVVFSDESGYYELKSEKGSRTNLRKYIISKGLIKE